MSYSTDSTEDISPEYLKPTNNTPERHTVEFLCKQTQWVPVKYPALSCCHLKQMTAYIFLVSSTQLCVYIHFWTIINVTITIYSECCISSRC